MSSGPAQRVLIFVVAYNAEKTITSVLSRIPVADLPPETEILVVDDRSADKTFEEASRHADSLGGLRLNVLCNPENQGYGGNQKIGYQYAIEHGFDVVVLLHGDGQYAPEKLPHIIRPLLNKQADACFGSRMMTRGRALKGGMPFYKYAGNRILTAFENRVLGMNLTEFHSGYRAYSVHALKRVPFRYNTNDFHFDSEIIIQFHLKGLRIKEIPIPTFYGDEICHVNGVGYAWHIFLTTLASRCHLMGIFYQRKFDVWGDASRAEPKLGYRSSHTLAVERVSDGASVLEIGCGSGAVARELKKRGCRVTGFDDKPSPGEAFDAFVQGSLDDAELPAQLAAYDFILILDRLEHLVSPERLLDALRRRCYADNTTVVLTAPNIGFVTMRLGLLMGQFNYSRQGILDLSHKRLFTYRSFRRLVEQEGYSVHRMRGVPAPFPKALGNGWLARTLLAVNQALIALWPRMFAYQIYLEAGFHPPLHHLLECTVEASRRRALDSVSPGLEEKGEPRAGVKAKQAGHSGTP